MKVCFFGTSHGVPEKNAYCTSTVIETRGRVYIFDAGAPISGLLRNYNLKHNDVKTVFITHVHNDHTSGLFDFCTQISWYFLDCKPKFYLPEQSLIDLVRSVVRYEVNEKENLNMSTYSDNLVYDDGFIRVTARRTNHLPNSFAFVIECEGKKVLISGDMSFGFAEFPKIHNNEAFDLIVCEGAHFDERFDLGVYASANTKKMLINHINPVKAHLLEPLRSLAEFDFGFAHDGMSVEV